MQTALQNYSGILTKMGLSEQEMIAKIQAKLYEDNQ